MMSGFTSQREIDGTKRKFSKGIILIFLALIFKVAVAADDSTKVYMLELEFEKSVNPNVTELLRTLIQLDVNSLTARVTEIISTTDCTLSETNNQKICSCMPQYTWSEDICKKYACCKDESCTIKVNDTAVCLSDKRVSINGTTILANDSYNMLCDSTQKNLNKYKELEKEVIYMLKTNFSTLKYFDSLIINAYRYGSVIVDYTVQLLGPVKSSDLVNVTNSLNNSELTTTGLVTIHILEAQPIDVDSSANITCKPAENLGNAMWYLKVQNKTTEITQGNEASFTKNSLTDILILTGISGSWKGTITCVYTNESIKHTASKELDIALLPEIQAMSTPQFPYCYEPKTTPTVTIVIECNIYNNNENYSVEWSTSLPGLTEKDPEIHNNVISYKAKATIICAKTEETVEVNCTFTNNRATINKNRTKNVQIPIITSTSTYCEKDKDWPNTKSNYTASIYCANYAVGLKTRECRGEKWEKEISSCVNVDLDDIQNDLQELNKGIGYIKDDAKDIFARIKYSTSSKIFNAYANINVSVNIFEVMNNISRRQKNQWNDTVLPDFVCSASNVLNDTEAWKNPKTDDTNLSVTYLQTIEAMVNNTNMSSNPHKCANVELHLCNGSCNSFNASVKTASEVIVVGFRNLYQIFPQATLQENTTSETTILSVTAVNNSNVTEVVLRFEYSEKRLPNHYMYCVFWDVNQSKWSDEGCKWGGADDAQLCTCTHNSAFTIMMAKNEETLPYMEELTYVGLGISIVSLVLCLIIEILIWDTVVKSDISNFRHVAIFNICLCLLLAHCGFLASAKPDKILKNWCSILTVVKHFFFLAVFFWMLCLSFVILHQIIFVFDHLRKRFFWGLSITIGYVCPILCVAITYITFSNGEAGNYYSEKTCWLIYKGTFQGSIFAFILPVGTIVFINLFTLAVVIMKIVTPTVSEAKARDEKDVAKSMIKTIIFLSPVLGITWIFGFFIMDLDLTNTPWAQVVNYTFTVLNSLQGFFILLTNCLGEKKVRDALRKRFRGSKQSAYSKSESSTKATYSVKNK